MGREAEDDLMKKRTFYNPETETKEEYTEVWKTESVSVKDIKDLLVTNHYWEDREGELWLDFEDPNENFRAAFNAYRRRKGYMEPQQIKDLRKRLGLDLRRFAERLGISYSKLSQIENNKRVQTLSQEVSFRKAQQDYQRQGFLTDYSATANVEKLLTVAIENGEPNSLKQPSEFYGLKTKPNERYFKITRRTGGVA